MEHLLLTQPIDGQIAHPDRVAWYSSLVQEWTGQAPQVMVASETVAAAWVTSYHSLAGLLHAAPTQIWGETVEQALEGLANQVYADLQHDLAVLATMQHPVQVVAAGILPSQW